MFVGGALNPPHIIGPVLESPQVVDDGPLKNFVPTLGADGASRGLINYLFRKRQREIYNWNAKRNRWCSTFFDIISREDESSRNAAHTSRRVQVDGLDGITWLKGWEVLIDSIPTDMYS